MPIAMIAIDTHRLVNIFSLFDKKTKYIAFGNINKLIFNDVANYHRVYNWIDFCQTILVNLCCNHVLFLKILQHVKTLKFKIMHPVDTGAVRRKAVY